MPDFRRWAEVTSIVTLSTAHLKPETRILLDDEPEANLFGLTVYPKAGFGWFIAVDDTALKAMNENVVCDFMDLYTCLNFANAKNCGWLCFDCDADVVAGLAFYDDDGTEHLAPTYTASLTEPYPAATRHSRHKMLITEDEAQAIALLDDNRNTLMRQYFKGVFDYRELYDQFRKSWKPVEGCPKPMKGY